MWQLLALIALGTILPVMGLGWFLRYYSGIVTPGEFFQMTAKILKNDYQEKNMPRVTDSSYEEYISR
jgi:hypothetical protein